MRLRVVSLGALLAGLCLFPAGIGAAMGQHGEAQAGLTSSLSRAAAGQTEILDNYFARARSIDLLVARNPAFRHFYQLPGSRDARLRAGGPVLNEVNAALEDVDDLFRESISEACLIDRSGAEIARTVRMERAAVGDLSLNERGNPFFAPTFALRPGQVYQSRPYVSQDTGEWVIGNATPIPTAAALSGVNQAIVHFEVSLDSFRRATSSNSLFDVTVVDATSGAVIIDSRRPQVTGAPLGRPQDTRFRRLSVIGARGTVTVDGRPAAFAHVARTAGNANDWVVFATSRSSVDLGYGVHAWTLWLIAAALALLVLGGVSGQISHRRLITSARTDLLTTLGNRRALLEDLPALIRRATPDRPLLLLQFDLNGFKLYNDTFGHPAGDALLNRLGTALGRAMSGLGLAYRLGGDEFCVLALVGSQDVQQIQDAAAAALTEHGAGFTVDASHGTVLLPQDTTHAEEALRVVDQRMYINKRGIGRTADQQSKDVLLRALFERRPELADQTQALRALVEAVSETLGLGVTDRTTAVQAAELCNIGSVAIPDAILARAGALSEDERAFLARQAEISERIIAAAPALIPVARLIRATQEWFDGSGHPDHLQGDQIPLGARILAVCITHTMLTRAPGGQPVSSADALLELQRQAGTRFDPEVVRATVTVMRDHLDGRAGVERGILAQ